MIVSLSTHLFVFYTLNEDLICMIRDSGFDTLEIWGMRPHFDYHDMNYVERIYKFIQSNSMRVTSFHGPIYRLVGDGSKGLWLMLSDSDGEGRKRAVDETITLLRAVEIFKPYNFVLHSDISEENEEDSRIKLMESLSELKETAQKLNIKLALESGVKKCTSSGSILKILEGLDSSIYGICIDVGHANLIEEPASAILAGRDRLLEIHVSDNNGEGDIHAPPGSGSIKWEEVMNALKKSSFNGNFVFEIMDPFRDNTRDIREFKPLLEELKKFRERFGI